jgi:hypothetical protein
MGMADTPIQPLIPVPRSGELTRKKTPSRKPRQTERDQSKKRERQPKKGIIDTYA